jgi:hypothetical protein
MNARRVTKAAIPPISAVIASVVLAVSVSQSGIAASNSGKAATTLLQPIHAAETTQNAEHFAAAKNDIPLVPTTPLLPVVDQKSIHANQRILADTVLRKLPSLCRDNLKNFYVLYQNASQRGLGGKSTIIIDGTAPDNEFVGLLVHECGHVIHGNLLGHARTGASNFKDGSDIFAKDSPAAQFFAISWTTSKTPKATNQKGDFVTGYAASDAFEDFAETFATYVLERPSMEARAKDNAAIAAKLDWMIEYLPLPANLLGTPQYTWDKKVPWDATKLAYIWNPSL